MGGRYILSGVQLGMLMAHTQTKNAEESMKVLHKIEDDQFIGSGKKLVGEDARKIEKGLPELLG